MHIQKVQQAVGVDIAKADDLPLLLRQKNRVARKAPLPVPGSGYTGSPGVQLFGGIIGGIYRVDRVKKQAGALSGHGKSGRGILLWKGYNLQTIPS